MPKNQEINPFTRKPRPGFEGQPVFSKPGTSDGNIGKPFFDISGDFLN